MNLSQKLKGFGINSNLTLIRNKLNRSKVIQSKTYDVSSEMMVVADNVKRLIF